jgi:predicted ATP-binding protein involved in virulence
MFEKWFIEESIAEHHNEQKWRNELHNSSKKIEEEMLKEHGIKIPLSGSPIPASYNPADRPYHASKIRHVQKAINECLSIAGWSSLEYEPNRRELIITNSNKNFIPVAQLSDGVKAMLSLTADIAYRCVQLNSHLIHPNPDFPSPIKETTGIVLIDEVDLHLHPKWQQTVLSDLCKAFPKIQFIVTTHSPQVISTVPNQQIRILDNGKVHSAEAGTQGAEASRILREVFGVELRPQHLEIVKKLNAYLKLIDEDKWDSEDALKLRQELDQWSQGNDPELFKVDIDIRMKEFQRQL